MSRSSLPIGMTTECGEGGEGKFWLKAILMERNGSPPFASFATLGQTSISETVLVSSSKERSPCARHSGAIPRRIGTAAVAGHFDEYPTTREEWSEPQGRNLNLCGETREQLTSMRPICT